MHRLLLLIALSVISVGYTDELALGKKCPKPTLCPQECPTKEPPPSCPPKSPPCKPCKQGDEILPDDQYLPSYNAPAAVALKGQNSNFFIDGSYLFWHASEEGLTLAQSTVLSGASTFLIDTTYLDQPFQYQSAFRVGLGLATDDGTIDAKYTWIRQSTAITASTPRQGISGTTDVWDSPWFVDSFLFGSSITSRWSLGIDLFDLTFGRPFYQGPSVIVSPFFGMRGALIRQYLALEQPTVTVSSHVTTSTTANSDNVSNSWGIGPRVGLSGSCLCYGGFKAFGDIAASLLFTQYTKISTQSDLVSSDFTTFQLVSESTRTNLNVLRPALEMGIGLAWGVYTPSQKFHFDVEASYDFSIFWHQNMMRFLVDELNNNEASSANNLYLHGLTVTAGFAF